MRLAVKDLTTPLLRDVSLDVRAGEIVGLAGLVGSGRTEVARAIFGADPIESGTVEIDGKASSFRHPRQAIKAGLGFITEDRKVEGLALAQSIADNMMLAVRTVMPRAQAALDAGHHEQQGAGRGDRAQGPRARAGGAVPVGRQPAEGRAGEVAQDASRRS